MKFLCDSLSVCSFILGDNIVDCSLYMFNPESAPQTSTHRCHVRKPYPLKSMEEVTFTLQFPLDQHITMQEFEANFTVRTEEQTEFQDAQALTLPIKSEYGLKIEGLVWLS